MADKGEREKREKVEKDSQSKREKIGSFRYTSMPLIDARIIRVEWRW